LEAQVVMFAADLGMIAAALVALAICGWWTIAPFAATMPYAWGAAAFAGLIVLPLASLSLTVVLMWPLAISGAVSAIGLAAASLVAVRLYGAAPRCDLGFLAALGAAAALVAVATCASADIALGGPGISYYDGTDHLGYAHAADWLLTRLVQPPLEADPADAYASFVDYLFKADPRFGSFALLALVSLVSGRPATFAYDLACALVLAASAIGLAACFARTRTLALAMAAAVLIGPLFDQGRAGFFGKLAGLSASVFAFGLYLQLLALRGRTSTGVLPGLAALVAITAGAALLYNGVVTAALLAVAGAMALAMPGTAEVRRDGAFALGIAVALAAFTTGIMARPLFIGTPSSSVPWSYALTRALGTDGQVSPLSVFRGDFPRAAAAAIALASIVALAVAIRARVAGAIASLTVPVVATVVMFAVGAQWHFLQTSVAWIVLIVGGLALLADERAVTSDRRTRGIALAIAGLVLALQLPHYGAAVLRYGRDSPERLRFAQADIARLVTAIGTRPVEVRLRSPIANAAIVVLVAMGGQGITFQWTPETWRLVLGYRSWPAPQPAATAAFVLTDREEANTDSPLLAVRTPQFDLLRR
jgi:hypothetical protein